MAERARVLIAQPIRAGTPQVLIDMSKALVEKFSYPDFDMDCVKWENEQPEMDGKYKANAKARNEFIEAFLQDCHDFVMWLDIDVVDAPHDLIQRLMLVSEMNDNAIVAPMVWDERKTFYDIGGFIKDGKWANQYLGVAGDADIEVMESVGTCYLVPAWLYRDGLRYEPAGDDVEHISFCESALGAGVNVLAMRQLNVTHAYLPNYGEAVH